MIEELSIEPFLNLVDPQKLWVYQPSSFLLICGGKTALDIAVPPPSLREAFLRFCAREQLQKYEFVLGEELTKSGDLKNYKDIMSLEAHVAEISSLVLLFSESYGSATELGAFAMSPPIAEKLLTVIDDQQFKETSFITLGPLRLLQNTYGNESVCVLNRSDLGIKSINDLSTINEEEFFKIIKDSIQERLRKIKLNKTFDARRSGDVIKLIVGIIQWYGALTIDELDICLSYFRININDGTLENYLHCAELVRWLTHARKGTRTYYAALADRSAVKFTPKFGQELPDHVRWQAEVRAEWKMVDGPRFNFISETSARGLE